jgi:hypothetical protein
VKALRETTTNRATQTNGPFETTIASTQRSALPLLALVRTAGPFTYSWNRVNPNFRAAASTSVTWQV